MQTWDWGEFKGETAGWQPARLAFKRGSETLAMASIGVRRLGPLKAMVVSKGPAMDYDDADLVEAVFHQLERRARGLGVVWLKIDPDVVVATGIPGSADDRPERGARISALLTDRGWRFSAAQVQFRNTLTIDLSASEDEILAGISGNTRRKIRVAAKQGVTIRAASLDDLPRLYQLYQVTAERDKFLIRPFSYYRSAWEKFMRAGLAQALIAEYDGRAIAHVILFHFGRKCWYFYGASANEERKRMPNYALQWEAIKWAKAQGYDIYDMWGAPDTLDEADALWGVYQFKRGFRGTFVRHIGAWDFAASPVLYYTYTKLAPKLLKVL